MLQHVGRGLSRARKLQRNASISLQIAVLFETHTSAESNHSPLLYLGSFSRQQIIPNSTTADITKGKASTTAKETQPKTVSRETRESSATSWLIQNRSPHRPKYQAAAEATGELSSQSFIQTEPPSHQPGSSSESGKQNARNLLRRATSNKLKRQRPAQAIAPVSEWESTESWCTAEDAFKASLEVAPSSPDEIFIAF